MKTYIGNPSASYAIGVDIGGTKINAGLVSARGEVIHFVSVTTLAGEADTIDRILLAIGKIMEVIPSSQPELSLRGIGVGSAGQIEWETGTVRSASELIPGYAGTPLKSILQAHYGLPVIVDNDVNVLALTEKYVGAGQGVEHFLCLALGTGVGGALVVEGRLVHGAWGGGGELGHMSVDFGGIPCVCGGVGCLEQYASGTSIAKRMREKLATLGLGEEMVDSREVFARWQLGDPVATELMNETLAALSAAIASLIHMFNPSLIVIGGGVSEAGERLFVELRQEVSRRIMPAMWEGVRIVPAYQGNSSGMIGAALQLWE
ncbi:ROK family protein [Paenibacillus qinlingensis]|uniref:Glucokinase n=1 Tax=Paenibacillus qinlingensis TaxID=1837343 RepID=A0ABU1NUE0_9BACL|nr:ROK family protein [Paenibacillus qinlingensis]MDR6551096.1 glucokinase [Paenibacillus qinlingensis]